MESAKIPFHHRVIHHVRKHKEHVIKHVKKHHKKYIFGVGFLGGGLLAKTISIIVIFFGVSNIGGVTGADYYDMQYYAQQYSVLYKLFSYTIGDDLSRFQNPCLAIGSSTENNDVDTKTYMMFLGKTYCVDTPLTGLAPTNDGFYEQFIPKEQEVQKVYNLLVDSQ